MSTGTSPPSRRPARTRARRTSATRASSSTGPSAAGASTPRTSITPTLRRYLAYLGTQRLAKRTIARKAAALRSFLRYLKRRGVLVTDSGRSLRAPKGPARLPRVPSSDEAGALLDRAATRRPGPRIRWPGRWRSRTRDPRGALRHRAAGLRVLRADPAGLRPGRTDRSRCSARGPRCAGFPSENRPRTPSGTGSRSAVRWSPGPTAHPTRSSSTSGASACPRRDARRIVDRHPDARWAHLAPTRPPARLRYALARRWSRSACRAGAARPRRPRHHPDLHPSHPRAPSGGLRGNPSPCLTTRPPSPPKPTPPRSSPGSGATTRKAMADATRASA